ncbi:unnamed protein product [Blepharisma stoltei]|uniref:purine-nucleoside phosphorylase n=1 Tax=Blepharisma stoltei TaxID=1481888 RepID=A0AAU9IZA3_9CILI|nr:unnamed protein product [Blepharisma stoltei]
MAAETIFPSTTAQLDAALKISCDYILKQIPRAEIAIILGTGLSHFHYRLDNLQSIDYQEIPYLPTPTTPSHEGVLYFGQIDNKNIYCFAGRLHGYEGFEHHQISYISHLCAYLGCNTLLITNASGCSMPGVKPGDIVFLQDYIKHYGENPLDTGLNSQFSKTYENYPIDTSLIDYALEIAENLPTVKCYRGNYFWVRGPSFETPYEIECYTKLGGDLYGMSTIPELLVAQAYGMRVLVACVVSNLACGLVPNETITIEMIRKQIGNVQNEIEGYFVELIGNLTNFEGKINIEPINEICNKGLHNKRKEVNGEHIMKGIEWFRQIEEGFPQAKLVLAINSGQKPEMKDVRKVYYKEIPNFPLQSLAGRKGQVIFGTINQERIVCLLNCDFEGLDIYESYYFAQVLIGLGVNHLHYIFPTINQISSLEGINDYISFQLQGCAEKPSDDAESIKSLGIKNAISFAGPSLPTQAEHLLADKLKCSFITISNFAILSEVGNRGLSHSASCFYSDFQADSLSSREITSYITSHNFFSQFYSQATISFPFFYANSDLEQLEAPEDSKDLEDLTVEIKAVFDPQKAVIVSDSIGELLLRHFEIRRSFAFGSFFPQTFHFTAEGIMIIKGSPILRHKDNHHRMMYPTFMVNRLGIDNIIIIEEVSTCSEDVPIGTWAKINQQCQLVSFNPLFGPNVSNWGIKFPDMSDIFTHDQRWREVFQQHRVSCKETKLIFTSTERAITGKALSEAAKDLGAEVIGKSGPFSVQVSQHRLSYHSSKKILYLCYAEHDPISGIKVGSPPVEHQLAIKELILL